MLKVGDTVIIADSLSKFSNCVGRVRKIDSVKEIAIPGEWCLFVAYEMQGHIALNSGKDINGLVRVQKIEHKKEEQMSDVKQEMNGLFQIRAVNKDTNEIVYTGEIVAEGEKEALFESDLKESLVKKGLKKDDVHIVVKEFGQVPVKERAKTVKILGQCGSLSLVKDQK